MRAVPAMPLCCRDGSQVMARCGWALSLLVLAGCSSRTSLHLGANSSGAGGNAAGATGGGVLGGVVGNGGSKGSGGGRGTGGLTGSGGVTRTGGVAGAGSVAKTGGVVGGGGIPGSGGAGGAGGRTGSGGVSDSGGKGGSGGVGGVGGVARTGGVAGASGISRTGGIGAGGGTPGSGGMGGTGGSAGTTGSSGALGLPCMTDEDCRPDATCCDGSSPGCDGTRLPSGEGTTPGEFVVSADGLAVTDTVTGLIWQRDGSSPRLECSGHSNLDCTWAEAQAYCASLVLGGVSGWRLPGWMELLTILDPTTVPAIDETAFPNPPWESFWTSSAYLGRAGGWELYVDFGNGTSGFCVRGVNHRVRCVRGSRCYPNSRFVVLEGGLVRDTLTGLVWQQEGSSTAMPWADAQSYCSSLGSGFRLPTLKEIDSLVDPTVPTGATIDKTFPSTGTDAFWTSSSCLGSSTSSRYGDFSWRDSNYCELGGGNNCSSVGNSLRVRCVR